MAQAPFSAFTFADYRHGYRTGADSKSLCPDRRRPEPRPDSPLCFPIAPGRILADEVSAFPEEQLITRREHKQCLQGDFFERADMVLQVTEEKPLMAMDGYDKGRLGSAFSRRGLGSALNWIRDYRD
jgi:hypothetical protein